MPSKRRRFIVTTGVGPSHNLRVFNNNVASIEGALTERYFLCKDGTEYRPAFDVGPQAYRDAALCSFRDEVLKNMPDLPRLTRRQVVDRYTGPKKRVYERALLSLSRRCLSVRDSRVTMFTKFEKQDVSKAPRGINPRDARYNLELGRYLKHAEHPFFRAIHRCFKHKFDDPSGLTVIKGVNADKAARVLREKWDSFNRPVAVGLDAKKFDMHVHEEALKYEHSYYNGLFPRESKLKWMLRKQLRTRGRAWATDGDVKFRMKGTRCSGDLNTSLGNCIIMCALVYAFAIHTGIRICLANNGDDCVVFMEERDLERFTQLLDGWFKVRGFDITVEPPATEFEQIEFCQTHPVLLSTGWRMVRNMLAVLTKDPICLIPVHKQADMDRWFGAVGECGGILNEGVPVMQEFYNMYSRSGRSDFTVGLQHHIYKNTTMYQRIENLQTASVDARARVSYYYAFGVLPDEQLCLEQYYGAVNIADVDRNVVPSDGVLFPGDNIILTL